MVHNKHNSLGSYYLARYFTCVNLQMRSSFGSGPGLVCLVAEDPGLILVSEDRVTNHWLQGLAVVARDEDLGVLQDLDLLPEIFGPARQGTVHGAVGRQPADDDDLDLADLVVILPLLQALLLVLLAHS